MSTGTEPKSQEKKDRNRTEGYSREGEVSTPQRPGYDMTEGRGPVRRGWIYKLAKEELSPWLQLLELGTEGGIDDWRKRLSAFVAQNPERCRGLEGIAPFTQGRASTGQHPDMAPAAEVRRVIRPTSPAPSEGSDTVRALNQIRKWGCHFDGRDPIAFLERVEELQACYGLSGHEMLAGLPELLRTDALMWYRNHRDEWADWDDFTQAFREAYLPRRYRTQLLRELQSYQQGNETYAKYATGALTLMRRAGRIGREQLEQLYEGLRPEYKLYIRRSEVESIGELGSRAREFEAIEEARKRIQTPAAPRAPTTAAVYNRDECCWRCKQRGHTRANCQRPARKFCSQCGKDGVLTRECHPPPGNAERAGDVRSTPAPVPKSE